MQSYWTISIACFLKDLEGQREKLKSAIKKYQGFDCGFLVPERSRHLTVFAIARYPEVVQEESDALPSFLELRDEIDRNLKEDPACVPNGGIVLKLTGVESWSDGLSFQFTSADLKEIRQRLLKVIEGPYSTLSPRYNWYSLLHDDQKSRGQKATACIIRLPLGKEEKSVLRWQEKWSDGKQRNLTCKKMYLVLSNPSLTNPHDKSLLISFRLDEKCCPGKDLKFRLLPATRRMG